MEDEWINKQEEVEKRKTQNSTETRVQEAIIKGEMILSTT